MDDSVGFEAWKKDRLSEVCGIMDELIRREDISCGSIPPIADEIPIQVAQGQGQGQRPSQAKPGMLSRLSGAFGLSKTTPGSVRGPVSTPVSVPVATPVARTPANLRTQQIAQIQRMKLPPTFANPGVNPNLDIPFGDVYTDGLRIWGEQYQQIQNGYNALAQEISENPGYMTTPAGQENRNTLDREKARFLRVFNEVTLPKMFPINIPSGDVLTMTSISQPLRNAYRELKSAYVAALAAKFQEEYARTTITIADFTRTRMDTYQAAVATFNSMNKGDIIQNALNKIENDTKINFTQGAYSLPRTNTLQYPSGNTAAQKNEKLATLTRLYRETADLYNAAISPNAPFAAKKAYSEKLTEYKAARDVLTARPPGQRGGSTRKRVVRLRKTQRSTVH
jgi:hypothetical protein